MVSKPPWIRSRFHSGPVYDNVRRTLRALSLHSVCESASCPNKGECWGSMGTVTLMILGDRCTRKCAFCGVNSGMPQPVDHGEPERVAQAVHDLALRYVVITSVTRDDLADGGAGHFALTVEAIRRIRPETDVEVLVPDFSGCLASVDAVHASAPRGFGHNVETVPRLTAALRSGAQYNRSLALLEYASGKPGWKIKSALMLGLGETQAEIETTLKDLVHAGVSIVHVGQYLQPSKLHEPVHKYYTPAEFAEIESIARHAGVESVLCGPLVRSSFHAADTV